MIVPTQRPRPCSETLFSARVHAASWGGFRLYGNILLFEITFMSEAPYLYNDSFGQPRSPCLDCCFASTSPLPLKELRAAILYAPLTSSLSGLFNSSLSSARLTMASNHQNPATPPNPAA